MAAIAVKGSKSPFVRAWVGGARTKTRLQGEKIARTCGVSRYSRRMSGKKLLKLASREEPRRLAGLKRGAHHLRATGSNLLEIVHPSTSSVLTIEVGDVQQGEKFTLSEIEGIPAGLTKYYAVS